MSAAIAAHGRLTADPREITTKTGTPMTVARLAVTVDCREGGQNTEQTLWLGLTAFGKLAEQLARHRMGETLSVSGGVQIARYERRGKDGETAATEELKVIADGLVSARTVRPGGGRKRKPAAAPDTPDPLPFAEPDRPRPEQPEPVTAGPLTLDDIPF